MAPESPLSKKLQIKTGAKVLVLEAPDGYLQELEPLPDGAQVRQRADGAFDVVQLFATAKKELDHGIPAALRATKPGGVLWISWPKQTAKRVTDLTRDSLREYVERFGLQPVASIAVNEVWSALRFKRIEQAAAGT
jgi:hypothetical protein